MKRWPALSSFSRRYRWSLAGVLTLALAAYWLLADETPMADPPPPSPTPLTAPASAEPAPNVHPPEFIRPGEAPEQATGAVDIFAVRTWEPPPPVVEPVTAGPPPPPAAPPLPFRYAGKLEEPGKATVIFLTHGEQMLAVSPGQLIDGRYRVGKLEGGQLHFLYRPLNIRQSIPVGGDT